MTQIAIRLNTIVLPGKRIEVSAPELTENDRVELIILQASPVRDDAAVFASALDYLDSLPRITRTPEEWQQIERELLP